jgi:hypothetical protein
MRYRLLSEQGWGSTNDYTPTKGMWKPCGGVQIAESPEYALSDFGPVEGRWLVLCEDDHTWRIFTVAKRTETDIIPSDEHATDIASALRS